MDIPKTFDVVEAQKLLSRVTAPWIQDLNLEVDYVSQFNCRFILKYEKRNCEGRKYNLWAGHSQCS